MRDGVQEHSNEQLLANISELEARVIALERRVERATTTITTTRDRLRMTEFQLAETEGALWQLSQLFANVAIPIVIADREGRIIDANTEAERKWQIARADVLGQPLSVIVPEHNHPALEEMLRECLDGVPASDVERRLWDRPPDVRSAWLRLAPTLDRNGHVTGVVLAEDPGELKATGSLLESVNEGLRGLALFDDLTQLANRRQFETRLSQEIARAARHRGALSLLMIDVDDFKVYNDSLGHPAGDSCLRRVANTIAGCLQRPGDMLARYGGEEFAAVLPDTEHHGAVRLAERMRAALEVLAVPHPAARGGDVLTVSIGVGSARVGPEMDPMALRDAADRALYAAKRAGRNRVRAIALPDPAPPMHGGERDAAS